MKPTDFGVATRAVTLSSLRERNFLNTTRVHIRGPLGNRRKESVALTTPNQHPNGRITVGVSLLVVKWSTASLAALQK